MIKNISIYQNKKNLKVKAIDLTSTFYYYTLI